MTRWNVVEVVETRDIHGDSGWTHLSAPFGMNLSSGETRIFVTSYDERNRGFLFSLDFDLRNLTRRSLATGPILGPGHPGEFDCDGIVGLCVVEIGANHRGLIYSGFRKQQSYPYDLFAGIVEFEGSSDVLVPASRRQLLFKSLEGEAIRAAAFMRRTDSNFELFYGAGTDFIILHGRLRPTYRLFRQRSHVPEKWSDCGELILDLNDFDYGYGRPWIHTDPDGRTNLYFSVRDRLSGGYRLGFATIDNTNRVIRDDSLLKIDAVPPSPDFQDLCYASTISVDGKDFLFVNGRDFGKSGFLICERSV